MKRILQLGLLVAAIAVGLLTSIFGTDEIANWLNTLRNSPDALTAQDIYGRIILFLLSTFFAEILIERLTTFDQIDKIDLSVNYIRDKVKPFFEQFLLGSRGKTFHEISWKYLLRGAGHQEDAEAFTVNRPNSINLWRDCLVEAESWEAISYANDLWQNSEKSIANAHQKAHVELDGYISRIYVFDDEKDRDQLASAISAQLGFLPSKDVRWIYKRLLIDHLKERLGSGFNRWRQLDLLDFSIIDHGTYVLWFHLKDGAKQLDSATITVNNEIVSLARIVFEVAYSNGQEFAQRQLSVNAPVANP